MRGGWRECSVRLPTHRSLRIETLAGLAMELSGTFGRQLQVLPGVFVADALDEAAEERVVIG